MKKNLVLAFNHEEERIPSAILVNGEPLFGKEKSPDYQEYLAARRWLQNECPDQLSVNIIVETLLKNERDGGLLARFAFAVGFHVAQSCPDVKINLMLNMITCGKTSASSFVEHLYKQALNSRTADGKKEDAKEYAVLIATMSLSMILVLMQEMEDRDE